MPALIAALLLVAACAPEPPPEASGHTRVAAVPARPAELEPGKWCDTFYTPDQAPLLELPPVQPARPGADLPAPPGGRWIWLNLWATWCGPCLREMPLLESWKEPFAREGAPFELWYLSIDEEEEVLRRFLARRPDLAPGYSLHLSAADRLGPWLEKYRLAAEAAIPIHLLADPAGRVRCVHVGQLHEGDYPVVKALLL